MALQVYINGKLYDKDDAKISVYDHGLLYGDGVFEGIRVYSGRVFRAADHLTRLWDSAKAIRLTIPYTRQEVQAAMEQTIKANNFTDCYIRAFVTRGVGTLGIDPTKCPKPSVVIISPAYSTPLYGVPIAFIARMVGAMISFMIRALIPGSTSPAGE